MLVSLLLLACSSAPPPAPEATPEPTEVRDPPAPSGRLDLNTATPDQLRAIPGMTPKMIHEFEEYRPYVSVAQFRKEIGKYVAADQIAAWEPWVYVPVAYDACDLVTLEQLPGVTPEIAGTLTAGRPYGSREAFLAALTTAVGEADATAGAPLVP